MSASNYLENKLIDHSLGTTTFTRPAGVYLALFTGNPGEDGAGPEVSGNGYARQAATWNAAVNGAAANASPVSFPVATGSWGTLTHFAIYDALAGGNLLHYGALNAPVVINNTDQFIFNALSLSVGAD